jgi:hypothetical protein
MELSEAIILGSVGTEQGFGPYQNNDTHACALKAALIAVGRGHDHWAKSAKQWPWINKGPWACPEGGEYMDIQAVIFVLNDRYKWTRPQIAAWVATIEPLCDSNSEAERTQEEDAKCTTTLTTPNSSPCQVE